jgi:hypothetical protein
VTPTDTAIVCGPPPDWVIYTVRTEDTLESIANTFRVKVRDLQFANCLGDSTVIAADQTLFVPNFVTETPTPTPDTPTPTSLTPVGVPTNTPSATNAKFSNLSGPSSSINSCTNFYSIDVTDPDGIQVVKLQAALNDPNQLNINPQEFNLSPAGGATYGGSFLVDTSADPNSPTTVYYRFVVLDAGGLVQYYPSSTSAVYSFTDSLNCVRTAPTGTPGDSPAVFTNPTGPNGNSLSIIGGGCYQTYSVDVTDPQGIFEVRLVYNLNDPNLNDNSQSIKIPRISGNTYKITIKIDTSNSPGIDTVYWKFKVYDLNMTLYFSNLLHWYIDNIGCQNTATTTPKP